MKQVGLHLQASQGSPSPLDVEVTEVLRQWSAGDVDALGRLLPLVLDDLRRLARRYLEGEGAYHTLQPTALVNEFYLKVVGRRRVDFRNRAHFFGFAAQTMRRILVDHARSRKRLKRGGSEEPLSLSEIFENQWMSMPNFDLVVLHDLLERLEAMDRRQADVVQLRYFLGLTVEETAAVLDSSPATIKRDWQIARLWLYREMARSGAETGIGPDDGPPPDG